MAIEAIGSVGAAGIAGPSAAGTKAAGAPQADFASWLGNTLQKADQEVQAADSAVQKLVLGEGNLHEVMLGLERARVELELAVQVRNRLLEAYQDILRMQV